MYLWITVVNMILFQVRNSNTDFIVVGTCSILGYVY